MLAVSRAPAPHVRAVLRLEDLQRYDCCSSRTTRYRRCWWRWSRELTGSWKLSSDELRVVFEYLPPYCLLVYLVKCLFNVYCVPGTGILVDLQRQSWQALAFCSQSTLTTNGHALLVQSKDSQRFRLSGLMWNALLQDMLWEKSQL